MNNVPNTEKVDNGFGRVEFFQPIPFEKRLQRASFVGKDQAEIYSILRFFLRQRGRRGEFYAPSWVSELPVSSGITAAGTTIEVTGEEYAEFNGSPVYTGIFLRVPGGYIARKIVSAVAAAGKTTITVDFAWGQLLSADQIKFAGWLPVQRFAVDQLQIDWLTDAVGQMDLQLYALEDVDA